MTINYGILFRFCRWIVRRVTPSYEVNLSAASQKEPVVYVAHHQNLYGPFMAYLWMPNTIRVWMLHVFLDQKACYEQYKNYTFTKRLGWNKTFAAIVAKIVSSFVTNLMKSGRGIPVYRGSRDILKTFQISVNTLKNGQTVAIFPDIDYQDSTSEVKEMYEGFLFLEKYYFRETGQHVNFVPLYVSESKRRIVADKVISFQSNGSFRKESKLILKQI